MTTAEAANDIRHSLLVVAGRDASAVARLALVATGVEAVRFDELHILTTLDGSRGFIRRLRPLRGTFRSRKVRFTKQLPPERRHVDLLRSATGAPIETLEGIGHLSTMADQIAEWFARHRQDGQAMTVAVDDRVGWLAAVVYAALHCVAEPDDHLWCVAPGAGSEPARKRPGGTARGANAAQKVEVPLVPPGRDCRLGASERFTTLLTRRTVERTYAQRPPQLVVNLERHTLSVGEAQIKLKPAEIFWYGSLLILAPDALKPSRLKAVLTRDEFGRIQFHTGTDRDHAIDHLRRLAAVHRVVYPHQADGFAETLWRAAHRGSLATFVARTNKALRTALGEGATPYLVNSSREEGGYRVQTDRLQWRLVPDVTAQARRPAEAGTTTSAQPAAANGLPSSKPADR